jgi:hypothetical protein
MFGNTTEIDRPGRKDLNLLNPAKQLAECGIHFDSLGETMDPDLHELTHRGRDYRDSELSVVRADS